MYLCIHPTQSTICFHLLVNKFQKIALLIVQYKNFKSCSEDFILQNLIFCTRLCGTGLITQRSWLFHFYPTKMVAWKCFVPLRYQHSWGISGRLALKLLYMIHRVRQTHIYILCIYIPTYINRYNLVWRQIYIDTMSYIHKHNIVSRLYLCIYVSMYLCIYVSMYIRIYVYMYLCIYVYMYICIYVSMYIRIYVYMFLCIYVAAHICNTYVCTHRCIHVQSI